MKYNVSHKENPQEYRRLQSLNRRQKDPVGYLLRQAKYRAKLVGKEFSVTKEDLEVPEVCPVFGIPLFFTSGRRGPNSYSIDRIDNSEGYTKENTRIISFWANQMKGNMTVSQVESLLNYMKGI